MARPSIIVAVILAALPLGCAGHVERALVDPGKYQIYNCRQLARALETQRRHAQEVKALYDKAAQDSTGTFVAKIAYEPDYLTAIGDIELIEAEQRDKKCTATTVPDTPAQQ